jgi:Cft2 family RNA processing exonuclease
MKVKMTLNKEKTILSVVIKDSPSSLLISGHKNPDSTGKYIVMEHHQTGDNKIGPLGMHIKPNTKIQSFQVTLANKDNLKIKKWINDMRRSFPKVQAQIKAQQ